MREIKFRVSIKCSQCGFKGFQYYEWNGQSFTPDGYDKCKHDKMEIVGDIQQFTGLKDKNGKDIYEGDIVKFQDWKNKEVVFGSEHFAGFTLKGTDLFLTDYDAKEMEVIGNIFEKPELLTN